jgi:DNA phosphorothioation-dependent restriction protein DptF
MSECNFINILNRLRKSSSDSIDNVDSFDAFKEYMHVVRNAENDLKGILRQVNGGSKKTLILLCGSAGDGKSHLLSYLKNSDSEKLLENYVVYNDATESNAPNKTAIDTLYEVLSGFKNENLDKEGQNTILAINLGVLSNFIESEYGSEFSKLKEYVFNANILTSKISGKGYDPCISKNVNAVWALNDLYIKGNSQTRFINILEKHLQSVYEDAYLQGYAKWRPEKRALCQ